MSLLYEEYAYLYPPRPSKTTPPATVDVYERQGYVAQIKRNGDCTMIFAKGNDVRFMNRHNEVPKRWKPSPDHIRFFTGEKSWNVFAAERVDDTLYIFDHVVRNGAQLVNHSFEERQNYLYEKWDGSEERDEIRVHEKITVAKSHTSGFLAIFNRLGPKDEGLVMKRKNSVLFPCFKDNANGDWQIKSRRTTKNYTF